MENISLVEALLKFITTIFNLLLTVLGLTKRKDSHNDVGQGKNAKPSLEKNKRVFVFGLDNMSKGVIEQNLRSWYNNGRIEDFDVKIIDNKEKEYQKRIKKLDKKITKSKNSAQLEKDFTNLNYEYKDFLKTIELKQKACYFFLKDEGMQHYMGISSLVDLQKYIYELMTIDYFKEKRKRQNDDEYITMELSIYPIPQVCNDYFLAPIKREDIKKVASTMLDFPLLGIQDYGIDVLHEISMYYYFFLAEEVVIYGHTSIEEDKNVMSLLKYQIGVH